MNGGTGNQMNDITKVEQVQDETHVQYGKKSPYIQYPNP